MKRRADGSKEKVANNAIDIDAMNIDAPEAPSSSPTMMPPPSARKLSADERLSGVEARYGFVITPEEKEHFRKLDAKMNKSSSAEQGQTGGAKPKGNAKGKGKAPASKKPRIAQDKADMLSMMEEVLDEDGDVVPRGQKGGDAFEEYQTRDLRTFDTTLESIVNDRSHRQSTDAVFAHKLDTTADNEANRDIPAETCPPRLVKLLARRGGTNAEANDADNGDPLEYVHPRFLAWLQTSQEYDVLEIDHLQPLVQGHHQGQPGGSGLDLCETIEWIEHHMVIDFWRAVIYRAEPEGMISPSIMASLMNLEEPWFLSWLKEGIIQDRKLDPMASVSLPTLAPLIVALDFTLDKTSQFLVRLVYVCASFDEQTAMVNQLLACNWLTPSAAFDAALKALKIQEPGSSLIVPRGTVLQRDQQVDPMLPKTRDNEDARQTKRPLSLLKATFAGYYYHTPNELRNVNDQRVHANIYRDFVFTK